MQLDRILAVVYSTGKVIWIPPMRAVADCSSKAVLGAGEGPHTCKAPQSTLLQRHLFQLCHPSIIHINQVSFVC